MDALQIVFAGVAGILTATAAVIAALRRASAQVQRENRDLTRRQTEYRMWRDKASTLIYGLLGVIERNEPYHEHFRYDLAALEEIGARIDRPDDKPAPSGSQGVGVEE